MGLQGYFEGISMVLRGYLNGTSRVLRRYLNSTTRVPQQYLKGTKQYFNGNTEVVPLLAPVLWLTFFSRVLYMGL